MHITKKNGRCKDLIYIYIVDYTYMYVYIYTYTYPKCMQVVYKSPIVSAKEVAKEDLIFLRPVNDGQLGNPM